MFETMLNRPSSWLCAEGDKATVVLSSRIRLARNISGFTFPPFAEQQTMRKVVDFVGTAVESSPSLRDGEFLNADQICELDRAFLIERHLISPDFLLPDTPSALLISARENISIMVNEEDHLRIQSLGSGLSLSETLANAMNVDDELAKHLDFDYDTDFGFLTSCPTNVGTGMRASILIHLVGLVLTKEIDSVIDHITKLGLVVRGFYGEGSDVWGNLFQISNQTTLGRSEADIVEALEKVTRQIIEFENNAREKLIADASDEIADKIWRSYGILSNARVLTSEETMNLLSALRLGIGIGVISSVTVKDINELLIMTQPAHLQKSVGEELGINERDVARAELVRNFLRERS